MAISHLLHEAHNTRHQLRRGPSLYFTLTVILTDALLIGAIAALTGVFRAKLFR
jgi:hypothetical protein